MPSSRRAVLLALLALSACGTATPEASTPASSPAAPSSAAPPAPSAAPVSDSFTLIATGDVLVHQLVVNEQVLPLPDGTRRP